MPNDDPTNTTDRAGHVCSTAELGAAEASTGGACKHLRYSVDVHEQIGRCIDCGAEGRMTFVVGDPVADERTRIVQAIRDVQAAYDRRLGPGPSVEASVCSDCIGAINGITPPNY